MPTSTLDPRHPAWRAALTVTERARLLRRRPLAPGTEPDDPERTRWRLDRWRAQAPLDRDDVFLRRLAADGLDAETFGALLDAPLAALRDREEDGGAGGWAAGLEEVLRPAHVDATLRAMEQRQPALMDVVAPFFLEAQARLRAAADRVAADHPDAPFRPAEVVPLFFQSLIDQAVATFGRVLTLELHVARMQGSLEGGTPEERFRSFARRTVRPEGMVPLLREYAPAARLLLGQVERWVEASAELLRRLAADRERLAERFARGAPPGRLARVRNAGVGDLHGGGRSVAILEFDSGLRVVYKPRSLGVEAAFQALLGWLDGVGACPPFRKLAVLDRGAYGWVEFVDPEPCRTAAEVERYYERLGGLLALLHALDGHDVHMENLIAAGEHPVLVDLETLFHPLIEDVELDDVDGRVVPPDDPSHFLGRSVLKTALLPQRFWEDGTAPGVDLSGIGGRGDQVAPRRAIALDTSGSDEARVERVHARLPGGHNLPVLDGDEVDPLEYADAVERGFLAVYDALAARRDELTPGGALAPFRGTTVRVVIRITQAYAVLLQESFHPDLLRDALDRDRFFDKLWLGAAANPRLRRLIRHEREALHRADIPHFTTTPGTRDLVADTGAVLDGFFDATGFERVAKRLAGFGPADRARQRWLVRAALASLADDPHAPDGEAAGEGLAAVPGGRLLHPSGTPAETDPAALVRHAEEIAARLAETAIRASGAASWLTLSSRSGRHLAAGTARYDLYGGLPGIVLFLDALARDGAAPDGLTRDASAMLARFFEKEEIALTDVGAFSGLGGVVAVVGRLEVDAAAREELARRLVRRIADRVEHEASPSLFGGAAGAAAGLLAHHAATGCDEALGAAARCGARIVELLDERETSAAGEEGDGSWRALGFLNGAAGTAWALLRLADATGDARYRARGLEMLEPVRRAVSSAESGGPSVDGWDGVAGVAPAFLAARRADRGGWDDDVRELARLLLRRGLSLRSHAMVAGTLGTLDALCSIGAVLPDAVPAERISAAVGDLLHDAARRGWRCGTPGGLESPGLAAGLAGIGYGLLRVAAPERRRSPLTLGL